MSDWAEAEGYTTLEDVFKSRDFGRHIPEATAAAAVPVARAMARPRRAHFVTNRAIAVISAGAAGLSVVATLLVNGGGPSLAPLISAQQAPSNVPDFLTPIPSNAGGQGSTGSGGSATGAAGASNAGAGVAAGGAGSPASSTTGSAQTASGGTVLALGPSAGSATLTSFTTPHPAAPPAPPAPAPTISTTVPPISAGGASSGGRDKGQGNGGQSNGNGNANGVGKNGGGGVVITAIESVHGNSNSNSRGRS